MNVAPEFLQRRRKPRCVIDHMGRVPQIAATPLAQQCLLVDNPARLYGFG